MLLLGGSAELQSDVPGLWAAPFGLFQTGRAALGTGRAAAGLGLCPRATVNVQQQQSQGTPPFSTKNSGKEMISQLYGTIQC